MKRYPTPNPAPPANGLALLLRADPNPDFRSDSHNGSVQIAPTWRPVKDLAEAQREAIAFRDANELGGGNWTAGAVSVNGVFFAAISYNGRIWLLDAKGSETSGEILIDEAGRPSFRNAGSQALRDDLTAALGPMAS